MLTITLRRLSLPTTHVPLFFLRPLSSGNVDNTEWRKAQLDDLSRKFDEPLEIGSDQDLQPTWKDMESRVTRRRLRTLEEAGERIGRTNIRATDEDEWLQAGMYDQDTCKEKEEQTDEEKTWGKPVYVYSYVVFRKIDLDMAGLTQEMLWDLD